ncbi:hypothetical protein M3221_06435 [Domibacillus indicus]|uniref:hypothetical protein n=1 Tax=Domibacillus indicus TaxID=1437523 RepID=UPI00203ED887|nr:hypothetical protein [Domibacillus indicus]MCM3788037.1 hypothetical protein [Domibacillus indicus]
MRNDLGAWYFIVPGTEMIHSTTWKGSLHRLTPHYSIEMGKRSTKPGYAVLNLPAVYSLTYQVLDLLYQQVPVANKVCVLEFTLICAWKGNLHI